MSHLHGNQLFDDSHSTLLTKENLRPLRDLSGVPTLNDGNVDGRLFIHVASQARGMTCVAIMLALMPASGAAAARAMAQSVIIILKPCVARERTTIIPYCPNSRRFD